MTKVLSPSFLTRTTYVRSWYSHFSNEGVKYIWLKKKQNQTLELMMGIRAEIRIQVYPLNKQKEQSDQGPPNGRMSLACK